jgi:hypothetical protein
MSDLHAFSSVVKLRVENRFPSDAVKLLPILFPNLQQLEILNSYQQPTFAGLPALLPSLRSFSSCELGDIHLAGVCMAFPNLRELLIPNSTITNLMPLSQCPQLETVNLWGYKKAHINQEMVQLVDSLPNLQRLNLGWTKLDDSGLDYLLSKDTTITVINVQDCRLVTVSFKATLRQAYPQLTVYDDDHVDAGKPSDWNERYDLYATHVQRERESIFALRVDGPGGANMCDRCCKNSRPREWNTQTTSYCDRCDESLCEHCCTRRDIKYCGMCDDQTCSRCYDEDAWVGYCELCDHSICDRHPELTLDRCRRCRSAVCTTCVENPTESALSPDEDCRSGHDLDGDDEGPDIVGFLTNLLKFSELPGVTPELVRAVAGIRDDDE